MPAGTAAEELPPVADMSHRDLRLHLVNRHDTNLRGLRWMEMVTRHRELHAKTSVDHSHRKAAG